MCCLTIKTYSSKNQVLPHSFYVLSKGLNSGKPLEIPTANCFVICCKNEEDKYHYYWLCFGLWRSKYFHPYLVGSVIEFLRIDDFKAIFSAAILQTNGEQKEHHQMIISLQKLDALEKSYKQNLLLIQDAKNAVYLHYIRHK